MGVKNITNINKCTATDIVDYFGDIIGDDLESIIYKLYSKKMKNEDKEYIDKFVRNLNLTDQNEINRVRKNMIYSLLHQSIQNNDYNIKLKILYEIYVRYNEQLSKPENAKKMKKLKDIILEGNEAVVLSHNDGNELRYDIITREEPKSLDSAPHDESKDLIGTAIDTITCIEDFNQIIKIPTLASSIVRKRLIEFMYDLGADTKEVQELTQSSVFKDNNKILNSAEVDTLFNNEDISDLFNKYLIQYLKENMHLIDIDVLYKNAVARLILGIKIKSGEEIDEVEMRDEIKQEDVSNAIRNSIRYLEKFYKELAKKPSNKNIGYQLCSQDGREIITIDLEYIKKFLQRCTKYKYYSDEDIEVIHRQIKQGILPENMDVRRIAQINIDDLINVSKSYEAIEYDEEKKAKLKACGLDIIKYLKEIDVISSDEQLLELYINGDLNVDMMQETGVPELPEEIHIESFRKVYEQATGDDEGVQKRKLARYSELYKKLIEEAKLDKDNLVTNLIETYGEDSGNKVLVDLYNLGMINLEDCINWVGTGILTDIFEMENRNIQPSQINSLYHNNKLSLNEIANLILRIPNVEERYITIASIFPEISESEERQELLYSTIDVDKSISKGEKSTHGTKEPTARHDYNKHITDSTYRFNLIRLFDPEYFMEMTADGHAIIKLPNFNKVMIEKMLDTKKQEGYGAASYILDENYYVDNETEIKIDGRINRKELSKALKEERAVRIFHVVDKWGEQIKQYLEGVSNTKYTGEEEQAINAAIESIRNSVKIIGK